MILLELGLRNHVLLVLTGCYLQGATHKSLAVLTLGHWQLIFCVFLAQMGITVIFFSLKIWRMFGELF